MNNPLVPMKDMKEMAHAVAASRLFGLNSPEQALALMAIAQAEGQHPAIAARDYHIVQGRPTLKADAMLARFQQAGGTVAWRKYSDEGVVGVFAHPAGGEVAIEWTWEMAEKLGFTKKDNWRNYPRAMMRARCISEGIRTVYPACVAGIYTPEEAQDMEPRTIQAQVVEPEIIEGGEYNPVEVKAPDGSLYRACSDANEAKKVYFNTLDSIQRSRKYTEEERAEKLAGFREKNQHLFEEVEHGE